MMYTFLRDILNHILRRYLIYNLDVKIQEMRFCLNLQWAQM